MLFFFSSTRTRAQLRGRAWPSSAATPSSSRARPPRSATATQPRRSARSIGRYTDGIAIRQCDWDVGNQYIREVAAASRVPVLNMQVTSTTPSRCLADLMTIIEKKGNPRGLTINVSYAYASSYQKPISVPQSLILLMTRFGMNVRLTHPPEFKLMPDIVEQAKENARHSRGSFEILDDFDAGIQGCRHRLRQELGPHADHQRPRRNRPRISKQYTDWITDDRRMALAKDDAIYMHCLPADRNIEVTDERHRRPEQRGL